MLRAWIFACSLLVNTGTAQQSTTPPGILKQEPPDFRACHALGADEKASAIVAATVTVEGLPANVHLARTSGNDCLDDKALLAVQQYRFRPATRDGAPIATQIQLRVEFARYSSRP